MSKEPDMRVVALLEEALARASRGDIRTVALVCLVADGSVSTFLCGEDEPHRLIGGLEVAKHRVMTKHIEQG